MTNGTATGLVRMKNPSLVLILLFAIINLLFLVRFADTDGYEGDDLNSIVPMAHLDAAKQGLLLIYRYAWQPLSYETGAALWRLFGTPSAVFLSAPVAGAMTLGLLFWWLWREGRSAAPVATAIFALLAAPELWYSALYFNSTILGMPLLVAALLLIRSGGGIAQGLIAGLLTGAAILMRIDFILICPLLAMAAWPRDKGIQQPIAVAVGVVAALLTGLAAGLLDLTQVMEVQAASTAEIRERANQYGWDFAAKILVLTISLSPIGWLFLLAGTPLMLLNALRLRDWRPILWLIAALPALYPILNILSPKYMLPLIPFLLLLFVRSQELVMDWLPTRVRGLAQAALFLAALLPLVVSISLDRQSPFILPGLTPIKPIGTHDGPRGYGGYLWQMMATDAVEPSPGQSGAARRIETQLMTTEPINMLIIGKENMFDPGGVGWRHLQLMLEQRGLHGTLIAPRTLRFDLPSGGRLILADAMPAKVENDYLIIDQRK